MTTPPTTANQYLAAFRSRRECCRALLDLSVRQQALVTAENHAGLVELLTHKQQVLDALLDAGRHPIDLWQTWRDDRDQLPGDLRQSCEAVLDDTEHLLQQLLTLEADSAAVLTRQRDETGRLLRDVNHGRQALAAYQSPSDAAASQRLDLDL
jgi:hypothetical protein